MKKPYYFEKEEQGRYLSMFFKDNFLVKYDEVTLFTLESEDDAKKLCKCLNAAFLLGVFSNQKQVLK